MKLILDRALRASRLDAGVFDETEGDPRAAGQAGVIAALSGLAAGIGRLPAGGLRGLLWGTAAALAGWALWAWLTWIIGDRLLPENGGRARPGALLRALGFASAPGVVRVLGVVPGLRWPVFFVASIWILAVSVTAVHRTLGYRSVWRAAAVSLVGWVVQALVLAILLALVGAGLAS